MIYARAHDQTVAEDYFAAMQRVEQRLEIVPEPKQDTDNEVVKVQEQTRLFKLIQRLIVPALSFKERFDIASQLSVAMGSFQANAPPKEEYEVAKYGS